MWQYHPEDRGDHWKFRGGSPPGVNERRRELCVVSTENNNHGWEGKEQGCTTSCSLRLMFRRRPFFRNQNAISEWLDTNAVRSADSVHDTDSGDARLIANPLVYIWRQSDTALFLERFQNVPYARLFFFLSAFLAHFPSHVLSLHYS